MPAIGDAVIVRFLDGTRLTKEDLYGTNTSFVRRAYAKLLIGPVELAVAAEKARSCIRQGIFLMAFETPNDAADGIVLSWSDSPLREVQSKEVCFPFDGECSTKLPWISSKVAKTILSCVVPKHSRSLVNTCAVVMMGDPDNHYRARLLTIAPVQNRPIRVPPQRLTSEEESNFRSMKVREWVSMCMLDKAQSGEEVDFVLETLGIVETDFNRTEVTVVKVDLQQALKEVRTSLPAIRRRLLVEWGLDVSNEGECEGMLEILELLGRFMERLEPLRKELSHRSPEVVITRREMHRTWLDNIHEKAYDFAANRLEQIKQGKWMYRICTKCSCNVPEGGYRCNCEERNASASTVSEIMPTVPTKPIVELQSLASQVPSNHELHEARKLRRNGGKIASVCFIKEPERAHSCSLKDNSTTSSKPMNKHAAKRQQKRHEEEKDAIYLRAREEVRLVALGESKLHELPSPENIVKVMVKRLSQKWVREQREPMAKKKIYLAPAVVHQLLFAETT